MIVFAPQISSLAPSLAERLAHIIDPVVSDEHSRNDAASMAALLEQTACFLLDDTQLSPQLSELMASSLQVGPQAFCEFENGVCSSISPAMCVFLNVY